MATNMVIAAVIEREGLFLVCQRPAHKHHGTLWEFPGGKLEPDETLFQAASRELKEELGINVRSIGLVRLAIQERDSGFMINFVEVEADGAPTPLEHMGIAWLTPRQLNELELAPADRKFVEHLNRASNHDIRQDPGQP